MRLLLENKYVSMALELATSAHKGQIDKAGREYIHHPIAVAESLNSECEQTAALLHDVVEDTDVTLEDLRIKGFPDCVVEAVECLTHREDEPRMNYLERISENPLAVNVKLADLTHNSDLSRIPFPLAKDYARAERYSKEIDYLQIMEKNK